jgi:transglutaminase-like putative cysteine protease
VLSVNLLPILQPLGAYQLSGLVWLTPLQIQQLSMQPALLSKAAQSAVQSPAQGGFLALDTIKGYLLFISGEDDHPEVLNPYDTEIFIGAKGLWIDGGQLWFCRGQQLYRCSLPSFSPQEFVSLPYDISGVTIAAGQVYVACQKSGYIHIFEQTSRLLIRKLPTPGIGEQNLCFSQEKLWICDRLEQSVYCLDPTKGDCLLKVLTPFEHPTAIAFGSNLNPSANALNSDSVSPPLWLAYAGEEPYLRDNPNNLREPLEIAIRDRTFIHPLTYSQQHDQPYALSNGYLVEMTYLEELSPLEPVHLQDLAWQMALPTPTHRQAVLQVESVGLPFQEILVADQRVALFQFSELKPNEARLFGWKAQLELRGIKYQLTPSQVEKCPELSPEFQAQYLVDDDQLAMDQPIVQAAAQESVGTETNLLRKVLKIRNYVYDRLSYALIPQIDTPDVVLARGVGSCGEYVGVLLALMRLNGIACRSVGRYKCPPFPERIGVPLQPDYNHVWLEFYVPNIGWIPMESNPDDVVERGPYPTRFFMGLPWYHVEIGKGIRFETTNYRDQGIRLGDLAINHVRFRILGELPAQP